MQAKFVKESLDLLSPKSDEELSDLHQRGFRTQDQGGKWQFVIYVGDIQEEYDDDPYAFGQAMGERLESKVDDVKEYIENTQPDVDAEYAASELQSIADEYYMADDEDSINYAVGMAADWGDEYKVFFTIFDDE